MRSRWLLATAAMALLAPPALSVRGPGAARDQGVPRLVLWAWERPDDLRQLPRGVGVAFLAQTITIAGRTHVAARRRQGLLVDEGTPMIAVTRIEAPDDVRGADVPAIARLIADRARLPMVAGVQVDFAARPSQRAMYRRLLHELHSLLPPQIPLSMTALAPWCLDDGWLDELPVDEAVPMLFQPGAVRGEWPSRMPAPKCRDAVGVALGDRAFFTRRVGRTYVFNPAPWTAATVRAALEMTR
jgi:hypothetical protein